MLNRKSVQALQKMWIHLDMTFNCWVSFIIMIFCPFFLKKTWKFFRWVWKKDFSNLWLYVSTLQIWNAIYGYWSVADSTWENAWFSWCTSSLHCEFYTQHFISCFTASLKTQYFNIDLQYFILLISISPEQHRISVIVCEVEFF